MSNQQQLQQGAVGIDIGGWRSVIAVAKRGGVEVITNEANFRETPSVVGFGPNERYIGEAGNVKMKTNFRDTIVYPTRFLGLHNEYPKLPQESKYIPAKIVKGDHGKLFFNVNYQGQSQQFVAEQVVAAYLGKLRDIIAANKLANTEAVLSVPSYYTQIERKALMDAARIAELNVTRLLNECTAVALDYGIFRKNDLDAKNARHILFVDFGHCKLSAFAYSFTKEKMAMEAQIHERNLGCRDIDYILLEFYRKIFEKSSGGLDIFESKKAVVKLVENIEKERKILSANSEHSLNLEYLMEENDLSYNLKREEFEKLAEPVFKRVEECLLKIKADLTEKKVKLDGIEMVGGGTRIPAFQKIIEKVFKMEPIRTLNSSQSIAKGCALMAAMKSPLFKVAEYGLEELNNYPIKIFWNFIEPGAQPAANNEKAYPEKQTNLLLPMGAQIPVTKTIKFSKKESIQMLIAYEPPVEGFSRYIAYFKTPTQVPKQTDFHVVFKVKMNENGIVVLDECFLQQEYMEQTKVPKPKPATAPTPPPAPTTEKKQGQPEPTPQPAPAQEQFEIKKTKKTRQTPLKYDYILVEKTTHKELEAYFEIECKMKNQDRVIHETYERKNELESLIYNNKEKLGSTYKNFVNPADVPKLLEMLEQANNWLYSDGENASRGLYLEKIDALRPHFQPIAKRYQQSEELSYAYHDAQKAIQTNTALLNSVDPKYAHITQQQRNAGHAEVAKVKQLIANAQQLQSTMPGWENPVTSAFQVNKNINEMTDKVKKIMGKPVPPPPAPPKEEKKQQKKEEKPSPAEAAAAAGSPAAEKMDVENPAGGPPSAEKAQDMDIQKTS